jgi:hypothetical protein
MLLLAASKEGFAVFYKKLLFLRKKTLRPTAALNKKQGHPFYGYPRFLIINNLIFYLLLFK